MTMTIWEDWLVKINNDFRRRSRKVLLLVDNAPGHNIKKETKAKLTNVHVHYFRPNLTPILQPWFAACRFLNLTNYIKAF